MNRFSISSEQAVSVGSDDESNAATDGSTIARTPAEPTGSGSESGGSGVESIGGASGRSSTCDHMITTTTTTPPVSHNANLISINTIWKNDIKADISHSNRNNRSHPHRLRIFRRKFAKKTQKIIMRRKLYISFMSCGNFNEIIFPSEVIQLMVFHLFRIQNCNSSKYGRQYFHIG